MPSSNEMRRLNHLISETDALYHEAAVKLTLSDSAMKVLYTVLDSGGSCPLREVGILTGLSKQTLHSAVHKLAREGILQVEASGAKNKRLRFTEAGKQLAACTVAQLIAAENRILAEWKPEEVEQYLALTQRYLDGFRSELARLQRPSAADLRFSPNPQERQNAE